MQPDYIAAAGAIAGVTAGTILSLVYMAIDYLRHRPALRRGESCASDRAILRRLLALAIPITLSSSMVSLITLIDTKLVQGRLQDALGYTLDQMRAAYGNYSACMDLYNLPSSLMVALTASVIPAVSAAVTQRDRRQSARIVRSSLRVTALLAFPMGLGLWALSDPLFRLFYRSYNAELGGSLLAVLGIASIFTYGIKKGLIRIADAGTVNYSLSNLDTLVEVAAEEGYIAPEWKNKIIEFRDSL